MSECVKTGKCAYHGGVVHRPFYEMSELVQAVKDHAILHYEDGGWDVIVEAWDDAQIESVLRGCVADGTNRARNPKGAIARIKDVAVDVYADYQADAKNSAF